MNWRLLAIGGAIVIVFFVIGCVLLRKEEQKGYAYLSWIVSCISLLISLVFGLGGQSNPADESIPQDNATLSSGEQSDTMEEPTPQVVETPVGVREKPDVLLGSDADLHMIVAQADDAIVIALQEDYRLDSTLVISSGKMITLTSEGDNTYSLIASGDYDAVLIENGASLTIDGINITRSESTEGRGIHNWGVLILESGSIANHSLSTVGALGQGAGVMNDAGATFTMYGGSITKNGTTMVGGGIFIHSYATFEIDGGEITSNSSVNGGGIFNSGVFTMRGGVISDNKASKVGGGLANTGDGELNLLAGEIMRNTANQYGGGVANESGGVFTMRGSHVSENSAPQGGGIANFGNFTMHAGEITDNKAENDGGGLYSAEDASVSLIGGQILNNSPDDQYPLK